MEHHAYYVPSVKHPKFRFMRIMAFLEISFTFCLRKLNLTLNQHIVIVEPHLIALLVTRVSLHIRPTSSEPENIRPEYYEAEYDGQLQECHRYQNQCDVSLLDLASDVISVELRKMIKK